MLVRESDASLPDAAALKALDPPPSNVLAVGLLRKEYCCTAWIPKESQPPAGYVFKGLRTLWGRLDEETLAVAGRPLQIAGWARNHPFCVACGRPVTHESGDPTVTPAARWFCAVDKMPELSPPQSISPALIEANLPGRPSRR